MAEELNLSDKTLDRLSERLAKAMGGSGGGGGGSKSSSGEKGGGGALNQTATFFSDAFSKPLTTAAGGVGVAYTTLRDKMQDGMSTWQDLSKTGVNFGNDIVGMTAAAKGARLDLGEFASVIKNNSTALIGLGGNASKGAENFAKLSKEMADSGVTDQLKMMGMTSKDINEVLAIQLAGQQTVNMNDEKSRAKAIQSATALAFEMDQMSKLTGKTRSEQEEMMKKAQADMQAEAKLRLITMGKSEEEAAAIRDNYYKQQKEAELRGQGQMFKEVFATGTIQSEAAANQVAISGKEAEATMRAARATSVGDSEAATAAAKEARLENSKNMRDVNKLQLAVIGDSTAAGKTQMESMAANNAYYKAEQAVTLQLEREGKLKNITADEKAKLIQEETIKQAKEAQTAKGPGSESTEAMVKLAARVGDAESAMYSKLVVPMNEQVGPALKKFNEGILNSKDKLADGTSVTKVKALETGITKGYADGQNPNDKRTLAERAKEPKDMFSAEGIGKVMGHTAGFAMKEGIVPAMDKIADKVNGIQPNKRAEGAVINNPELAIIGEAGKEYVVPEDKMQTLMQNVKLDGLQSAAKALGGGDKSEGGVNLGEISKTISTTISSAQGSPASQAPAAPMSKNEKFQTADWADATQAEIAEGLEGSKKQLAMWTKDAQAAEQRIAEIKTEGAKRELDTGEQFELAKLEKEKLKNQRALDYHQSTINVLSNLDEYKARLETESKEKTVTASETAAKIAEDLGLKQVELATIASEEQKTVLTNHQKSVLEYAYTDEEGKKMQLENAKKRVEDEKNTIAEKNAEILALEETSSSRELTVREQSKLERLQKEVENKQESLQFREDELAVYSNLDKLKAENEIKTKTTATASTEEQLAVQAEAESRIAQLKADGVDVETESAKAIQVIKSDALNDELAKMSSSAAAVKEEVTKKAEAVVKPKQNPKDMFGDMFGDMLGGKGKELPPFMQTLNAQLKNIKPSEIKKPEENKIAGSTAQAVKKEPSPGKKINPETGEEYTPVPPAAKKDTKPAVGTVEQVGLKDLHTSLEHLNKSMAQLLSYSQQTANAAQAQVKATKGLSSNKFN